ncbi:hypothetical protein KUV62_08365 [Salipiger bermudensis]|nr:hypothetical protein [Salipiger bermudensis]
MSAPLDELRQVTALLRDRAFERHRRECDTEQSLVSELARIDALREAAFAAESSLATRRLIGADTVWQGWLAQRRGELNQALAQSRARQAHSLSRARLALARDDAALQLARRDAATARRKTLHDEDHRLEALWRLSLAGRRFW